MIDHFMVRIAAASLLDHPCGELVVVIPPAAIFPVLDFHARGLVAGEMFDRGLNGGAIGLGDFNKYAVHVEDE